MALAFREFHPDQFDSLQAIPATQNGLPCAENEEIQMSVCLDADQLRCVDIIPVLADQLEDWGIRSTHCQEISVVLSELFNNALDHGILGLNSRLKSQIDGWFDYFEMREELLSKLQHGSIAIKMAKVNKGPDAFVKLQIKDSGQGFHFNSVPLEAFPDRRKSSGRGIDIVKSLCNGAVEYIGNGNEVVALYALKSEG